MLYLEFWVNFKSFFFLPFVHLRLIFLKSYVDLELIQNLFYCQSKEHFVHFLCPIFLAISDPFHKVAKRRFHTLLYLYISINSRKLT